MKEFKPKIMLMSLGGSPEPLIKSIEERTPEQLIFLASHDSVSISCEIFKSLSFSPAVKYEITEDPNLLLECYKAARRCTERVEKSKVPSNKIMVDYTGGTKVMTAALILSTIDEPYIFNYVGGDQRNKSGVGTVLDGHEEMFLGMSPWSIFAEEERRQVIILFNQHRFSAVIEIINSFDRKLPAQIRDYFSFIEPLADGFLNWDQFCHKAALRKLDKGSNALEYYISSHGESSLKDFMVKIKTCRNFLRELIEKTNDIKPNHNIIITDLLNNAKRKIADKKYDDAAARIYRALELYGQIKFKDVAGCDNNNVKPETIPPELRDKFKQKYYDPRRKILKLPQTATFEFLKVKRHEAGIRFFERQKKIKDIQKNRNDSILAHGIKPVTEKAIYSIFDTVKDFVQETVFFDFPTLP